MFRWLHPEVLEQQVSMLGDDLVPTSRVSRRERNDRADFVRIQMTLDKLQTFPLPFTQNWKPNTRHMLRSLLVQTPGKTYETRYLVHQASPSIKVGPHTLGRYDMQVGTLPGTRRHHPDHGSTSQSR